MAYVYTALPFQQMPLKCQQAREYLIHLHIEHSLLHSEIVARGTISILDVEQGIVQFESLVTNIYTENGNMHLTW